MKNKAIQFYVTHQFEDQYSIDFYILPNGDWTVRKNKDEINFDALEGLENHEAVFNYSDGTVKDGFIHEINAETFKFTSTGVRYKDEN